MTSPLHPAGAPAPDARIGTTTTNWVVMWRTIRKHWATAVSAFAVVALATLFFTLGRTKIYESQATLQFDPAAPRPLGKDVDTLMDRGLGLSGYLDNREYQMTQHKIIASMRPALAVVQQLGLQNDVGFIENRPETVIVDGPRAKPEVAAQILRRRLTVTPVKDSRLATLQYEDANPARAQRILSALIDAYIEQNFDKALESTQAAVEWLHGQVDKLKNDLDGSEMALHEYKLDKNMLSVAFDDQSNMLRGEMSQLSNAVTGVRVKLAELAARKAALMNVNPEEPSNLPATELLHSGVLQRLREGYLEALRTYDGLISGGKGSHHPDTLTAKAHVDLGRSALLEEVRNIQGAVERDLQVTVGEESNLATMLDKAKRQALDLNLLEIEYNRLRRSKENNEKLYALLLSRSKENDLTRMLRLNNIHIVDRPLLPERPIKPRVGLNLGIGFAVGIMVAVFAAMGRTFLDRTVKTPDDVTVDLGLPFLGLLPEIGEEGGSSSYGRRKRRNPRRVGDLETRELIVHHLPASGTAEASRAIRTNLLFMAPDNPYKSILVTSAGPSEGKTTVACCIAVAMAQAGQRVCLVDCDLRRPRMHRIFKERSDRGVTRAILDENGADHAAIPTEVTNLSVVPAGPIPPNPAELFHSQRFASFIAGLTQQFDRVIIDSPPIVAVTDAAVLSRLVDGVVLVVRSFTTTKDIVRHGARVLQDVGAKMAGIVLNAVNLNRQEYQYYYYYYHREGYYSHTSTGAPEAPPDPPSPSSLS